MELRGTAGDERGMTIQWDTSLARYFNGVQSPAGNLPGGYVFLGWRPDNRKTIYGRLHQQRYRHNQLGQPAD